MRWKKEYFSSKKKTKKFRTTSELDPIGVSQYLNSRGTIEPRTLLKGVSKVVVGIEPKTGIKFPEMLVDQKPQGKLGVMLSGGVDSSILAKIYDNDKLDYIFIKTLATIERDHYKRVAELLTGVFHEVEMTPEMHYEYANEIYSNIDEPIGDAAIIGVYAGAKYAKEKGIEQLVLGEGADEMFGGYWHYESFDKEYLTGQRVNWETVKRHFGPGFGNFQGELKNKWEFVEIEAARRPDVPQDYVRHAMKWNRYKSLASVFIFKNIDGCGLNKVRAYLPFTHPNVLRFADSLLSTELVDSNDPMKLKIYLKKLSLELGLPKDSMLRTKSGFRSEAIEPVRGWMESDIKHLNTQSLKDSDLFSLWSLWKWCKSNDINLTKEIIEEAIR